MGKSHYGKAIIKMSKYDYEKQVLVGVGDLHRDFYFQNYNFEMEPKVRVTLATPPHF